MDGIRDNYDSIPKEKNDKVLNEKDKEFDDMVKNMNIDEKIKKMLDLKLEGNNEYKNKNYQLSIDKYSEGVKYLKKIENKNDKIKELEIALYLNLSLCFYNLEKFNEAYDNVVKVLNIDKNNTKGIFRLCQIEFNRCNFDKAKEKIQEFIKLYPDNIEAKKLLKNILIKQKEDNKKQKEAYSKFFKKVSGLYDDVEKEKIKKKREKYESDMKSRKEKNEELIDFDKWEILENEKRIKEEEEKKKEREKEKEKKKKDDSLVSNKSNNSSNLEIDEEDQKIIDETKKMGYCYFKKDIKDDDKKFFEKNIPKKLENGINGDSNLYQNQNKALSSWNAAGTTYEEKDMSKWAKTKIEQFLKNIHYKNNESSDCLNLNNQNEDNLTNLKYPEVLPIQYLTKIDLNEIKDLSVDAQIIVLRGSKRHIFEISCNLFITLYLNITELHIHKVIVELKELSSELEAGKTWKNYINIKKNDKLKVSDTLFNIIYDLLIEKVENQVKQFTEEYSKL